MSKTTTELLAEIAANFPDNTSAEITPELLRSMLNDAVASFAYGVYTSTDISPQAGAVLYCDTSGGSFNVTLPTSPAVGNIIEIRDRSGTWGTNNLFILPGGNNIESVAGTLTCNTTDADFDLIWRGGGVGWGVEFTIGVIGRSTQTIPSTRAIISGTSTVSFVGALKATVGAFAAAGTSVVSWVAGAVTVLWNASDKAANVTLTGGSLIASNLVGGSDANVRATNSNTGHKYFELVFTSLTGGANNSGVGIVNISQSLTNYLGNDSVNGIGWFADGYVQGPGVAGNLAPGFVTGDVLGVELISSTGTVNFIHNNVLARSFTVIPSGSLYPAVDVFQLNDSVTVNFGATAFTHLPAGATGWNT